MDSLRQHDITVMYVPKRFTATLQPNDSGVNRAFKCSVRHAFESWRATEVMRRVDAGETVPGDIDMRMTLVKGRQVEWIKSGMEHLHKNQRIVTHSWQAVGLGSAPVAAEVPMVVDSEEDAALGAAGVATASSE